MVQNLTQPDARRGALGLESVGVRAWLDLGSKSEFHAFVGLTYRDAGVDIEQADTLVQRIKKLAAGTRGPQVVGDIGGFASLFALRPLLDAAGGMADPLLVSGTDGVGTKLKVAFAADRHDTIGIDLVAMCVNDVVTTGAKPLFFLDYFASGKLDIDVAEAVVRGIADGCRRGRCSLVGGETAELPGLYAPGEYDLAGFVVGLVDRAKLVDGRTVEPGDAIIGVSSHGLHANGYSLARKVLLETADLALDTTLDGLDHSLADELLVPTALYTDAVQAILTAGPVKAMAHITGGGLPGNLPRVLPEAVTAEVYRGRWTEPPIFGHIQSLGEVAEDEMFRTFNMGIGLVAVVPDAQVEPALAAVRSVDEQAVVIGTIRARDEGGAPFVLQQEPSR